MKRAKKRRESSLARSKLSTFPGSRARKTKRLVRYTLEELLAQVPESYVAEEIDWGPPVGREIW